MNKQYCMMISMACSVMLCGGLSAHGASVDTGLVNIWVEDFTLPNGTTSDNGTTAWSSSYSGPGQASARFAVMTNDYRANDITINGEGVWTSVPISISGKRRVRLSVDIRSAGGLERDQTNHADYLRLYYKLDNGSEVLFSDNEGIINNNSTLNITVSVDSLSGSSLQVIIRAKATATDEFYFFDNVTVAAQAAVPVNAQATVSGALTCATQSVTLQGASTTPGGAFSWSGPGGFSASTAVAETSVAGSYTLTVTDGNGGSASASVVVLQNTTAPGGVVTTAVPSTAQITCAHPSVVLTSSSTTPAAVFSWSGPSGFTATGASTTVSAVGVYTVTVTDPGNGCFLPLPVTVTRNISLPVGLTASPSDIISCFTPTIDLQGASTTPGTAFSWSGPDGFSASTAVAETSVPGSYTLTVTNPANGCSASTSTVVSADTAAPTGVTAFNDGPLNCLKTSVTLNSTSTSTAVDFLWVTPDLNLIPGRTTMVSTPGVYTIVVTNNNNGCSTQATTTVVKDNTGCR